MTPKQVPGQQGTFFHQGHYGNESVVSSDRQFSEVAGPVIMLDETGLPIGYEGAAMNVQERNVKLAIVLNLLASAGRFEGLVKAGYLDDDSEHHTQFEGRYGQSSPYIRQNSINKRDRLTNQARIIFARAAGYITPEQAADYLSLYPDKRPPRQEDQPPYKPPKEPPFPEDVKPDIDREFRKFQRRYGVPAREGANDAYHKQNVAAHARARDVYLGRLHDYLGLITVD